MTHVRLFALAALITLLAPGLAAAQDGGRNFLRNGFQPPVSGVGSQSPKRLPPPPALPGATSTQAPAPARQAATDIPPNDALFDAIDRGDMAAAKDALARGADIGAVNVLGMTPIEMSVDLGHNDITFLLLSMRGTSPAGGRAGAIQQASAKAGAAPAVAGQPPAPNARAATEVVAQRRKLAKVAPEQGPPRVRYADTSGGSANPQAGFLGFGASAQP